MKSLTLAKQSALSRIGNVRIRRKVLTSGAKSGSSAMRSNCSSIVIPRSDHARVGITRLRQRKPGFCSLVTNGTLTVVRSQGGKSSSLAPGLSRLRQSGTGQRRAEITAPSTPNEFPVVFPAPIPRFWARARSQRITSNCPGKMRQNRLPAKTSAPSLEARNR